MADAFEKNRPGLESPADRLETVTPADGADLPGGLTRALFVGTSGSVVAQDRHGTTVTIASGASQYHPIRVARVLATGTTATGIVALY